MASSANVFASKLSPFRAKKSDSFSIFLVSVVTELHCKKLKLNLIEVLILRQLLIRELQKMYKHHFLLIIIVAIDEKH